MCKKLHECVWNYFSYHIICIFHEFMLSFFVSFLRLMLMLANIQSFCCFFSSKQPYLDVASAFGTGKILELETCIQTHREKFQIVSIVVYVDFSSNWSIERKHETIFFLVKLSCNSFDHIKKVWFLFFISPFSFFRTTILGW